MVVERHVFLGVRSNTHPMTLRKNNDQNQAIHAATASAQTAPNPNGPVVNRSAPEADLAGRCYFALASIHNQVLGAPPLI
jgi:hypothetical protein